VIAVSRWSSRRKSDSLFGGRLVAGGIPWLDFILVPVVASLTQQVVELLGRSVVDAPA